MEDLKLINKMNNQLLKLKTYYSQNLEVIITRTSILKLLILKVSRKLRINKKLVHAGSSRHQDMKRKIQSNLEALAHPEILCNEE